MNLLSLRCNVREINRRIEQHNYDELKVITWFLLPSAILSSGSNLVNLVSSGNQENNLQMSIVACYNALLILISAISIKRNSMFLSRHIGSIYFFFHVICSTLILLDYFPFADLDPSEIKKTEYLRDAFIVAVLILGFEFRILLFIAAPSLIAIEYLRIYLHNEYGFTETPINVHMARTFVTTSALTFYLYRAKLT